MGSCRSAERGSTLSLSVPLLFCHLLHYTQNRWCFKENYIVFRLREPFLSTEVSPINHRLIPFFIGADDSENDKEASPWKF